MSSGNRQQRTVHKSSFTVLQRCEYAGQLLATLALLRRDAANCDVFLQVESPSEMGGESASKTANEMANKASGVWAHSAVLAAVSPYFRMRFKSSFNEFTLQEIVPIKCVTLKALKALIENIYTPKSLAMPVEDVKELLAAATLLHVGDVRDAACTFLANALAADNALGIRAAAELNGCSALTAAATRFIHYYGERVLEGDEILAVAPDVLVALLTSDRLATREEPVFKAILRWTQHRPQERWRYLSPLMRSVNLSLVPRLALMQRVRTEPLVSNGGALHQVIKELVANREGIPTGARRPPPNTQPPTALLVIGGWLDDTGCTNSVLVCSLPGGRWQYATGMPAPRDNAGSALLDGRVYIIGGQEDVFSHVRTVFEYHAVMNKWSIGPPLNTSRGWPGAASLSGRLYAVGGWDGTEWRHTKVYNSVEALDPREGVWRPVASMVERRAGLGVAALGGMLYAIGGYNDIIQLNSTERYDPRAEKWETVEAMAERRDNVRVSVVDDVVYAVGGKNERSTRLRSMERYRPGSGWEFGPDMPASRGNAAVTSHSGRLYAAGGHNGRKRITNVSVFDPTTGLWNELPPLPAPRSAAAAAAVVVPWPPPST